jgi:hypothetical protein
MLVYLIWNLLFRFLDRKWSISWNLCCLLTLAIKWMSYMCTLLTQGRGFWSLGPCINNVTALRGKGYQWFCDNCIKALVIINVTMGERASKIIKNCVTSFMDDPFSFRKARQNVIYTKVKNQGPHSQKYLLANSIFFCNLKMNMRSYHT